MKRNDECPTVTLPPRFVGTVTVIITEAGEQRVADDLRGALSALCAQFGEMAVEDALRKVMQF